MDPRSLLAAPEPVPFSVHTTVSRSDVLDRLERSIGFHDRTDDPVIRFIVLRGSAASGHVDVIAEPYLTPDLRVKNRPPIALKAEVVPTAVGSDIEGTATAPVHRATPAFLALLLGGWVMALGHPDQLVGTLESIISEP